MSKRRNVHEFQVGDKVKLTGKFLRNTGQATGPEGLSTWTVLAVDNEMITVDQEHADIGYWTAEELAADPMLKFRRFNAGNLYRVGTLSSRNCP